MAEPKSWLHLGKIKLFVWWNRKDMFSIKYYNKIVNPERYCCQLEELLMLLLKIGLPWKIRKCSYFFHYNVMRHFQDGSINMVQDLPYLPSLNSVLSMRLRICRLFLLLRGESPHPKRFPVNDTKLYLMVRVYFWSSDEYDVPLHCHFFQVYSGPKWYYRLGSSLWDK